MAGFDFTGEIVQVVGAGRGIGCTMALTFASVGAEVTGFDREFPQGNYPFAIEILDMANAGQAVEACQRVFKACERLGMLVNAAGTSRMGATDMLSAEGWQQTPAVNVGGAFNLFQRTMARFRRQQGGAVVAAALDAAYAPRIGMSTYGMSKAMLESLVLTVEPGLTGSGVRCNVVPLGPTDTDIQRTLWVNGDAEQQCIRGFGEQFKLGVPLGKITRPQETTNTILFLASELASHITLQGIMVDGGPTLGVWR